MSDSEGVVIEMFPSHKSGHAPPAEGAAPAVHLNHGDGDGTSYGMVPIKDYIDARDEAVESRLSSKLDKLPTADSVRNNVWGAALTVLGILLAILAFGGDRFDAGLSVAEREQAQVARDAAQDRADRERDARFTEILRRLPPPAPAERAPRR